jgi:transcription antitermination factor NusG
LSQLAAATVAQAGAEFSPALVGPALRWYALHTRSRHEKLVARQLTEKQFEVFLPLRREVHRWRDRYQEVELPLFAGYAFVRYSGAPDLRLRVLRTPGVVRIVGFGEEDAPVPAEQIETLQRILGAGARVQRHRYLRVGQRVRVISGALAGVEGVLVRVKDAQRLVIAIEPIRQAVCIELAGYEVYPLG